MPYSSSNNILASVAQKKPQSEAGFMGLPGFMGLHFDTLMRFYGQWTCDSIFGLLLAGTRLEKSR
jgi:hypothetical protein